MSASANDIYGESRLANLLITFFVIEMAMMGLTLALRAAETSFATSHKVSMAVLVISVAMLALAVISTLIGHRLFQTQKIKRAWFIPAVGKVIVPLAEVRLGYLDLSWLFLSGCLIFWVGRLTLVTDWLMVDVPMPGKTVPTLMILLATPAFAMRIRRARPRFNGSGAGLLALRIGRTAMAIRAGVICLPE